MSRKVLYAIVIVLALILLAGIVFIAVSMKQPEEPADAPVAPTNQVVAEDPTVEDTAPLETEEVVETEPPVTMVITEEEIPDVSVPDETLPSSETQAPTESTEEPTEDDEEVEETKENTNSDGNNQVPGVDDWSVGEIEL